MGVFSSKSSDDNGNVQGTQKAYWKWKFEKDCINLLAVIQEDKNSFEKKYISSNLFVKSKSLGLDLPFLKTNIFINKLI